MRDDERLDTGAPAKAGPIGISVRVLWLALILFGLYSIIFDWPTNARGGGLLVATGFTLLMFSEVFNLVFSRNWGYRPVQVLIALAVVALVVDLLVYGEVWAAPLILLQWSAVLFVYGFLVVSFVVGIAIRLRGCELSALPVLAARMRGDDYDISPCILGLHRVDEWEDRRKGRVKGLDQ